MERITTKELIKFRRKSERSKKKYATKLKTRKAKEEKESGGGDYWISCTSAISHVFKYEDVDFFYEKAEYLENKKKDAYLPHVKARHQRNIDVVVNFADFDFKEIKPTGTLEFKSQPDSFSIINVNGFPIYLEASHVFSFTNDGIPEIGGVWFVADKESFDKMELGMFAEILYLYLRAHYSAEYSISTRHCVAVDIMTGRKTKYEDIEEGKIPSLIEDTINELKNL